MGESEVTASNPFPFSSGVLPNTSNWYRTALCPCYPAQVLEKQASQFLNSEKLKLLAANIVQEVHICHFPLGSARSAATTDACLCFTVIININQNMIPAHLAITYQLKRPVVADLPLHTLIKSHFNHFKTVDIGQLGQSQLIRWHISLDDQLQNFDTLHPTHTEMNVLNEALLCQFVQWPHRDLLLSGKKLMRALMHSLVFDRSDRAPAGW